MIHLIPHNETHIRVICQEASAEQELAEFFCFDVPGAKFAPKFKNGQWDGKIRLYNLRTKLVYKGLIELILKFAQTRNYEINIAPELSPVIKITRGDVHEFMLGLNLYGRGVPIEIRDYQIDAVHKALSNKRLILESATSSGKSLIIYSIIRYCLENDQRLVLIVPTVNLVNQMANDFKDYSSANGWDVDANIHSLYAGKERVFGKAVTVSTWQTIASMLKSDKENYQKLITGTDVLICDEAHLFSAAVVCAAIEGFVNTGHRIGTTGTMSS